MPAFLSHCRRHRNRVPEMPHTSNKCGQVKKRLAAKPERGKLKACTKLAFNPWRAAVRKLVKNVQMQKIKVSTPCTGIDGPGRALMEMGINETVQSTNVYDLQPELRKVLETLHGPDLNIHVGQQDGNILNVPLRMFSNSEGFMAGPPCPPFSTIGARGGESDPREAVFRKCLEMIFDLAGRSARPLKFFGLENVKGILSKQTGQAESYADMVVREIKERLQERTFV